MNSGNNRRIAKNTGMLYFRMLFTMFVSLYTSRIVLSVLGVHDYGIYNVVGGVVALFSFLSTAMSASSQRFFTFELGRNNISQLKKNFSMAMTIYIMVALLIVILAETVGIWFLNTKLNIPSDRMGASHWVYQFAIFSFIMTMLTIPYNASIIAHENMKVYAWMSIIEVSLKLLVVFLLQIFFVDKLILYAILSFGVTTLVTFLYRSYCKRKFVECRFVRYWDSQLFKEMASYSGWNLFGAFATVIKGQGANIVLNIFFGPAVNAANAIAIQVSHAINNFVINFYTAVRPQITKFYAENNIKEMLTLVHSSSRYSYYLIMLISIPVLLNAPFIFDIWLKKPPELAVLFTQLVIINALIDTLSNPLMTAASATGKNKMYQSIIGTTVILNVPISFMFLKIGYPPVYLFYISIIISIVSLFIRVWLVSRLIKMFSIAEFTNSVILVVLLVTIVSILPSYIISLLLKDGIGKLFIISGTHLIFSLVIIYLLGMSKTERKSISKQIYKLKTKVVLMRASSC